MYVLFLFLVIPKLYNAKIILVIFGGLFFSLLKGFRFRVLLYHAVLCGLLFGFPQKYILYHSFL
ncbi:hypothetical protein V8E52_003050 [Russula decolorans]